MVLLDVSHDQAMVDEGVAREVINRIQKLRKAAKLVPTDPVTVFYQVRLRRTFFYRVLTGSYQVFAASSSGSIGFYIFLPDFYLVLDSFTFVLCFFWVLLGLLIGFYWVLLGFT